MSLPVNHLYKFGKFTLDTNEKVLVSENNRISLTPKVFELLFLFVENSGKLITKSEILEKVWADSFVEESNLTFTINQLRKLLNDNARQPQFIETIAKRGYRFLADVEKVSAPEIENAEAISADQSDTPSQRQKPASNRKHIAILLGLLIISLVSLSGFIYRKTQNTESAEFKKVEFQRITTDGNAVISAISPDGKYIVYAKAAKGMESLFVRQNGQTKDIELISPQIAQYWGITVSPDNTEIYYTIWETNKYDAKLYKIPILGGTPKMLLETIDSAVSFSPDAKKITYFRVKPSKGFSELLTANSDGSEIKLLHTLRFPETFETFFNRPAGSPAWSPDGNVIAAAGNSMIAGAKSQILAFDVKTGERKDLTNKNFSYIEQINWIPNSNYLLAIASEKSLYQKQIIKVDYPSGVSEKITNDTHDYVGLSVTKDSKQILTIVQEQIAELIVARADEIENGRSLINETGKNALLEGFAWTPDDKIIFRLNQNNQDDIYQIDSEGKNRIKLTDDFENIHPTISNDGSSIIFTSNKSGVYKLWKMGLKGENPSLLTRQNEDAEGYANCSKVDEWCIYQEGWSKTQINKISLKTGEIVPLITENQKKNPTISNDGKMFAYFALDETNNWNLRIGSMTDGKLIKQFSLPETANIKYIRWSPDDRQLAYVDKKDEFSNIILQPIDGSLTKNLTNFTSKNIYFFDWSRDGKQFALTRGTLINNIVAINNLE